MGFSLCNNNKRVQKSCSRSTGWIEGAVADDAGQGTRGGQLAKLSPIRESANKAAHACGFVDVTPDSRGPQKQHPNSISQFIHRHALAAVILISSPFSLCAIGPIPNTTHLQHKHGRRRNRRCLVHHCRRSRSTFHNPGSCSIDPRR